MTMSKLKNFLQRTGRDLKNPTGDVEVIVDLNVSVAEQSCIAKLQAAGLVVRDVIQNKVVGTMPAERIEELRQLDSVREVELSVSLQRHQS